jgi:hypothetical protein
LQKHKFGVTWPGALFVESDSVPTEHQNSALMFRISEAMECTT